MMQASRMLLFAAALLISVGCTPVQPWQKSAFSRPQMALDPQRLESRFMRQVYESREASSGGHGVGHSGCGCN